MRPTFTQRISFVKPQIPRLSSRVSCRSYSENTAGGSTRHDDTKTTHFGFQTVPEAAKESLVKDVFNSVASKYDLMNDAMSMGVHRLWKDEFISRLNPGKRGPLRCIDVAGGTGDIALRILDHARENYYDRETTVEVVDINAEMLKEGFKRFKKTMYHRSMLSFHPLRLQLKTLLIISSFFRTSAPQISFTESNAQALSHPSNHYDIYTIAFGIRNCTSVPDVLKEAYRVLKPGGTFSCLEFSKVNNPLLAG